MKKFFKALLAVAMVASTVSLPTTVNAEETLNPGATVVADTESPSGYTVHFVYEATEDVAGVSVTGPFQYIDPELELSDKENTFNPHEYENGMYASNCAPGPFSWGYTEAMEYDEEEGYYHTSFPITSGSFAYSYVVTYTDGSTATIDDPANPSPAKANPESNTPTGDLTHSIVYGKWDSKKQSESPNLDFVRPAETYGSLTYIQYAGNLAEDQDIGVYLPSSYDENREEPYKVVYASHGGGGNETDWFAMGHADNIVENLGLDVIVVTMDNAAYSWDYAKIEDNVMNYIIPYMEANYNVSTEVNDRAFCGLSMGSMTTMNFFFDHPETFGYYGGFSGTDMSAITEEKLTNPKLHSAVFYANVGTCDIASENVMPNMGGSQIKYEDLIRWKAEHELASFIDGGYVLGAHDWFVWSASIAEFMSEIAFSKEVNLGTTTIEDEQSPSGYTVKFAYDGGADTENIAKVSVTGPFQYINPELELSDKTNSFSPYEYQNGMYASNCAPGPFSWGFTHEMIYNADLGIYEIEFPITSGSFAYSYIIEYKDGTTVTTDDPANPSPAKLNPESNTATGDLTHSIAYGHWHAEKQSKSPNLDFVLPSETYGSLTYVQYKGNLAEDQDIGVYLPSSYDENRKEPYKVVYASHGGGGNETDWFAMGHADNIVENLGLDVIVVTMDNAAYNWDYAQIEDNVINYIIPYMEENYNVSTTAQDRAFCGLSMGSMTTMNMFFDHPEAFKYFGGFSGTDMSAVKDTNGIQDAVFYANVGTCDIASENVMPNMGESKIKYEDLIRWEAENDLANFIDGGYVLGAHDWFVWSASIAEFMEDICWTQNTTAGTSTVKDETSPSGYTVHFGYDASNEEKEVAKVYITGPFQYVDPEMDLHDKENAFGPHEYENGMYATNCAPGPFSWGYTEEMTYNVHSGLYETSFPITSGSFAYSYIVEYTDGTTKTTDDPVNPSPAKLNPESNTATGDLTHSIAYGHWDAEKQSKSPNLDFVLPSETYGSLTYIQYKGNLAEDQDIGIYLPSSYDAERKEPYKVVYASHGGGGNETDWFAMGHVDNIVENLGLDVIVVTMDNAAYNWDYAQIEDNVINYIIPYMEENYNVSTEAKDRAFCGLSMGSMTTMHMFFDHPTEFGYFGGFSAADMSAVKDTAGIQNAIFYATVGTCDIASRNVAPMEGRQYEDLIDWEAENNLANFIDGGYVLGAHDWFVWSQSIAEFMEDICWTTPVNPDAPTQNTGDTANFAPYVATSMLSLAALAVLAYNKKRAYNK